jgi:hypothetical protein
MEHEHRAAKIRCTEEASRPLSMERRCAVGLLSALVTTCLFAGTMGAQDVKPNPPYDPAKVTIANEPPFFLSDKSIENPYSDPLYNPKTAGGLLSPLIFTHTTAVHGGLLWKKGEGAEAPTLSQTFGIPRKRCGRSRRSGSVDQLDRRGLDELVAAWRDLSA